jgi:hypothetical protein
MLKPAIVCKHKQTRHQANSTLPHAWTGRGGLAQKEGKIPPAVDVRQRIAVVCKKVNRPSPMPGQAGVVSRKSLFGKSVHRRQVQRGGAVHNELTIGP